MGDRAFGESQAGGALYPEGVTVGEAVGWKEKSVTLAWDTAAQVKEGSRHCGLGQLLHILPLWLDREAWGHQKKFRLTGEGLWLQAALQGQHGAWYKVSPCPGRDLSLRQEIQAAGPL